MRRPVVLFLIALWLLTTIVFVWSVANRRTVLIHVMSLADPPALLEVESLEEGVAWWDDYFTLEWLDERTLAIGEPRFAQRNFAYLILGEDRAVLFDTGPGVRTSLRRLVEEVTDLPVVAAPSHLHYDHVGNLAYFDEIALMDVAGVRDQLVDGVLVPTPNQFLGQIEDYTAPRLRPTEWWPPGARIDLGGRTLLVVHTPGHTPESISLWDEASGYFFAGDFLYPGPLFAFLPGSSAADYRMAVDHAATLLPTHVRSYGGHGKLDSTRAPALTRRDLLDLGAVLEGIEDGTAAGGSGLFPRTYPVNGELDLWVDPLD